MQSKRISIVIPVKNARDDLQRLLTSIQGLEHSRDHLEVVVCDNGSNDGTAELAQAAGCRVLELPGLTISGLRNRGAGEASGEVLAFVDADCEVAPAWLEAASRHLARQDVAAAGCYPRAPIDGTWVQELWNLHARLEPEVHVAKWLPSMNLIVKQEAFQQIGGFDTALRTCEDVDFCYRLRNTGKQIIWDEAIEVTHHGEPVDLTTLFRKERWHGGSNLRGLVRHGLRLEEVPSLVLPWIVLVSYGVPVAGSLTGPILPILTSPLLLVPPVIAAAAAVRTATRARRMKAIPRLTAIYLVYLSARAAALMGPP